MKEIEIDKIGLWEELSGLERRSQKEDLVLFFRHDIERTVTEWGNFRFFTKIGFLGNVAYSDIFSVVCLAKNGHKKYNKRYFIVEFGPTLRDKKKESNSFFFKLWKKLKWEFKEIG